MNTLEVLTLVLVIFAALAYIDNHQDKNSYPLRPIEDSLKLKIIQLSESQSSDPKYPLITSK